MVHVILPDMTLWIYLKELSEYDKYLNIKYLFYSLKLIELNKYFLYLIHSIN
jgi:hypothetical protein